MSTDAAGRVPRIGLVWAQAERGVIGRDGGMPWHVPEDLAHFKAVTLGAAVIMGRKTWDSLSPRYRPLPGRRNVVVTRQADWVGDGAERAGSLDEALALVAGDARTGSPADRVWVIGGGQLFAEAIERADRVELTELVHPDGFGPAPGDVHAPPLPAALELVASDPADGAHTSRGGIRYRFLTYRRA
ncbi:dihydrofolate reductase [Agromyces italicus]|uniref:dihydrofolate reductase n=1 Tax=Agromyces italicus TaxID=279572 RepID=UPI0003B4C7E4|nr:dihydrofolate reductase [Agromyces italicus]